MHQLRAVASIKSCGIETQDFMWGSRVVFILKRSDFDTTLFLSSRTENV